MVKPADRSPLVANLIARHPRFAEAGRGRFGLTSGAMKMVELALARWPDLTMAEFAAGVVQAKALAAEARQAQRMSERVARAERAGWRG